MFNVFKTILILPLLFLSCFTFAQSNQSFNDYLEGDYKAITENTKSNALHLASAYTHLGDYEKATALFEKVEDKNTALFLNEQGFLFLKMFLLDKAKTHFEKALTSSKDKKDKEGQRLATTNLALYHFAVGNFELQHSFAQQALTISEQIYGDKSIVTARMYNNIALSFAGLDKNKESLTNYNKALEAYQSKKATYINPYICRAKINISLVKLKEKAYKSAEETALSALNYTNQNPHNLVFVYTTLGAIYAKQKEYVFAENYLFEALKINEKKQIKERIEIYNRIADIKRLKGKYKQAFAYLDTAITLNKLDASKALGTDNLLSKGASLASYYTQGEIYFDEYYKKTLLIKHLKSAVSSFEKCITILDEERKTLITQKDKIRLGAISKGIYDKLIKSCYDLSNNTFNKKKYNQQVFLHIQQSKATVLNQSLNENDALNFSGMPEEKLTKERELKAKLLFYEQLSATNESKLHTEKLAKLRLTYHKFIADLEVEHPKYFNLKYQKTTRKATEIQQTLSLNKVLCSYYLSADASVIYIAYLDKNKLKITEKNVGKNLLKDLTSMRNFIYYRVFKGYNAVSYKLYKLLLPNAKFLKNKALVIFPDAQLNTIPFEALVTKRSSKYKEWADEPFLIKTNPISYGISTALYSPYKQQDLVSYTLCAPVNFDYKNTAKFSSLPYTKKEVLGIKSILKTEKVTLYTNEQANKENILNCKSDVIHLATHGVIDQENPQLSKLCLAPNKQGNFLYNNEIYNLNIQSKLVTMSACETGLGKLSKGEGVIGLTRAWIYAGAKNLVVSYWSVNDQATAILMSDFYRNISKKNSFTTSLQTAKLKLLKDKNTQAPYFWAGFVLIGE